MRTEVGQSCGVPTWTQRTPHLRYPPTACKKTNFPSQQRIAIVHDPAVPTVLKLLLAVLIGLATSVEEDTDRSSKAGCEDVDPSFASGVDDTHTIAHGDDGDDEGEDVYSPNLLQEESPLPFVERVLPQATSVWAGTAPVGFEARGPPRA